MTPGSARVRRWRERQQGGLVVLRIEVVPSVPLSLFRPKRDKGTPGTVNIGEAR